MKKRLLSILTCLALCLSMLPTAALAAEDTTPATPTVETNSWYNVMYVFANGTPITIEKGEAEGTSKVWYGDPDHKTYLDLDPDTDGEQTELDISRWSIYGGTNSSDFMGNTNITMTGGKVGVIASGSRDEMTGDTIITMTGGEVTGGIYGARAKINGSVTINLHGGTVGTIYGVNVDSPNCNVVVNVSGGTITGFNTGQSVVSIYIDGQCNSHTVDISGGIVTGDVYGGLSKTSGNCKSAAVNISGGTVNGNIYGGGKAYVLGDAAVTVSGGTVNGSIDVSSKVRGSGTITVSGGTVTGSIDATPTENDSSGTITLKDEAHVQIPADGTLKAKNSITLGSGYARTAAGGDFTSVTDATTIDNPTSGYYEYVGANHNKNLKIDENDHGHVCKDDNCAIGSVSIATGQHGNWDYSVSGLTITKTCGTCGYEATATLSRPAADALTYDGTAKAATMTKTGSWDDSEITLTYDGPGMSDSAAAPTNAGSYTATMAAGGKSVSVNFTIAPAPLTVIGATTANRPYNGTSTVEITGVTLDGKKGTDDVSVDTTGLTGTLSSPNAGSYTEVTLPALTLTGGAAGNYTLTQPTAAVPTTVTISKASLTIEFPASSEITYGDSLSDSTLHGGSTEYGAFAWQDGTKCLSAGTHSETVIFTPNEATQQNYTGYAASATVSVTVKQAESNPDDPTLSIATVGDKVRDVTISQPGTDIAGTWAWESPDEWINRRTYPAKAIFTPDDQNYLPAERELTIMAEPRTLTADMVTLQFNRGEKEFFSFNGTEQKPEVTVMYGGFEFSKDQDFTLTWSEDCINAGEKTVTITPKENGGLTGDAVTKAFTIRQNYNAPIIDGGRIDVVYSATRPVTIDLKPFLENVMIAGDNPSISQAMAPTSGILIPQYADTTLSIRPNNIQGPLTEPSEVAVELRGINNYFAAYVKFAVYVTDKIPVDIDLSGITLEDQVYDGAALAYTGAASAEAYGGEFVYEWLMKNDAGEYEAISEAPKNVGEYRLRVSVADTAHYQGEQARDVKITPRTVTITADSHTVYVGSGQPELTYTVDGLVGSDMLTTAPALTTDANMNQVGTYNIIPSGAEVGENYGISYVNGILTVKNYPYIPSNPTYPPVVDDSENGDVVVTPKNPEKGDTVTIIPDPDAGYEVDEIIVTDKNGNPVTVTRNGDGTYSFKQPGDKVHIEVIFKEIVKVCPGDWTCPMYGYADLDMTAWYHDGIHYCVEHGLMNGIGNNRFNPNGTTTRAMIVTILWRLEGSPVVNDAMDFEDVDADQWYTEAIRWAASERIVEGYGDSKFGTNNAITREQMVTILFRYAGYKGYDVSVGENTNILSYDDAFDVADWAIPAMQWACGSGMIQGIADGNMMNLAPQGNATRAQAAAILQRFCENVANKD